MFGEMVSSAHRPRVLRDAFRAGRVPVEDLPELIAFARLHDDSPTSDVSEADWLRIFATVRFFSYPGRRSRPTASVTLYRATSAERQRRMSWTADRDLAVVLGRRHTWHAPAALYQVTVEPDHILAFLGRPDEGWTVVTHPAGLMYIRYLEELPRPTRVAP